MDSFNNKLTKGKALRKQSLHEKTAETEGAMQALLPEGFSLHQFYCNLDDKFT